MRFHRFDLDPLAVRHAGLLILVVCVSCLFGWAQSPVTVVNPPSNPVPVSGSVNAAVSGNVGIVGTPTVSVQTPSAPPTTINGQTITPVLVRDMDERARHPFAHNFVCATDSVVGGSTCTDHFTVPQQQELVIEYVQFYGIEHDGMTALTYLLNTSVAGLGYTFYYPRGTATWSDVPMTHELTRIYADPGSTVTFTGVANIGVKNVSMGFYGTVYGYLIDVP